MLKTILYIAIGGAIGSVLRYLTTVFVSKFCPETSGFSFPLATFIANVIGCFLIGLFFGILHKLDLLKGEAHFFFIVGFTGGLTTFSSFALDNILLFRESSILQPLIYSLGSIVLGILMVVLGLWFSKLL